MQTLAVFGNRTGALVVDGHAPGFKVGESYHRLALEVMVIGASGEGAKGDSWGYVDSLGRRIDRNFFANEGVQTGEGFIAAPASVAPMIAASATTMPTNPQNATVLVAIRRRVSATLYLPAHPAYAGAR
jgi:hypothetical protein